MLKMQIYYACWKELQLIIHIAEKFQRRKTKIEREPEVAQSLTAPAKE